MNGVVLRRDSGKLSSGFFSSWRVFFLGIPVGSLLGWCIVKMWQRMKPPRSSLHREIQVGEGSTGCPVRDEPSKTTQLTVRFPDDIDNCDSVNGKLETNGNDSGFSEMPLSPPNDLPDSKEEDFFPDTPGCEPSLHKSLDQSLMMPFGQMPFMMQKERADIQIPTNIVGRFIGRQGRNIKSLMEESGSQIHVQQQNVDEVNKLVPCVIQGTHLQIMKVLDLISSRHPEAVVPTRAFRPNLFSFSSNVMAVSPVQILPTLAPIPMKWDTVIKPPAIPTTAPFLGIVTHVEEINRFWVVVSSITRQLDELIDSMAKTYFNCNSKEAAVFQAIEEKPCDEEIIGKYCVARVAEVHWLRARVTNVVEVGTRKEKKYRVHLVDYGSYALVQSDEVKPIR